jgi:hypothetical protein
VVPRLALKLTLSLELASSCEVGHYPMDSTRPSSTTARSSRGISARACVAKTMTWELNSAKGVLAHDASINKVSLTQEMWKTQEDHQINENHKKMLK